MLNIFSGCTDLNSVTILNPTPLPIGSDTFYNCSNATLYVPVGSKSAYETADYWCEFKEIIENPFIIEFSDSRVKALCVENWDFNKDGELSKMEAAKVTSLDDVFSRTIITSFNELQHFTGLTSVGNETFEGCSSLTSIIIPNSVTNIENRAFAGCTNLISVTVLNPDPVPISSETFSNRSNATLYVPYGSKSAYENASYWCEFKEIIEITSITLNYEDAEMQIGESLQLGATVLPEDAKDRSVTWSSSDKSVASVSSSGLVIANKVGTATITATANDGSGATAGCVIQVRPMVSSIVLNHSSADVLIGENIQLEATVLPEDAKDRSVTWSSSDESIASVSSSGLVTAHKLGTASITVAANDGSGISATCGITVKPILVASIVLNKDSLDLYPENTFDLTVTLKPENATFKEVTWKSSREDVAIVEDGHVTALKKGTARITATTTDGSNLSAICHVNVFNVMASFLSLDKESMELLIGDSKKIKASVFPSEASQEIAWTSSNSDVAEVENGIVTGKKEGKVTITAKTTDKSNLNSTCEVTVKKHTQGIEWNQQFDDIFAGGELVELRAQASSGLKVRFHSSNENVASIFDLGDSFYFNPNSAGLVTMTATQSGNDYWAAAESVSKTIQVIDPDGIAGIMDSEQYEVYTLSGMKIGTYDQEEFQKIKQQLTKGVYILNGKKVVIR